MRWLFIRFYIGIAIVLLLAAGLFYLRIQRDYENEQIEKRNEKYVRFVSPMVERIRENLTGVPEDREERARIIEETDFRSRSSHRRERPRREPPEIRLVSLDGLDLPEKSKAKLENGEVIVLQEGEKRLFFATVPGGDVVSIEMISRRPQELDEEVGGESILVLLAPSMGILMLIGVTIFLLIRPIERRIAALAEVTRNFGAGALDARAKVGRAGTMDELEESFNAMAGRIEELVDGQRELLRAVSHDLRTPLARIFFALDEAQTARTAEGKNEHLGRIDRSLVELNDLVEELTAYMRLDNGIDGPSREWIDVSTVMRHASELVADLRPEISLDLSCCETRVFAEPRYVKRAVANLVTNAVMHARKGVWIACRSEDGAFVLSVDDDGSGIPEEDRERVFEPFFRRERSRNIDMGGSGLGLAIVARIMTWHGGTVHVSESRHGGASFTLSFPGGTVQPDP